MVIGSLATPIVEYYSFIARVTIGTPANVSWTYTRSPAPSLAYSRRCPWRYMAVAMEANPL